MPDALEVEIKQLYDDWIANPSAVVCARLADRLRQAGRTAEALDVTNRGLEEWPANAAIRLVAGRCLKDNGDTGAARAEFERVLEKDPLNLIALRAVAEIAMSDGRYSDAVRILGDYVFENPADSDAARMLEEAKERERTPASPDAGGAAEEEQAVVEHEAAPAFGPGIQDSAPALEPGPEAAGEAPAPREEAGSAPGSDPVAAGPVDTPPAEYPRTERMEKIIQSQTPAEPAAVADPPPQVQKQPLRREPRSLLDLFTAEEKQELDLEPYRQEEQ
jgi:tetratricopeptide (TPR) repeat protein